MSKRAFTPEYKIEVLSAWESGNYSLAEIAKKYKVFETTIKEWKYKFDKYGTEDLKESSPWKPYTKELKYSDISDYLSGNYSLREVAKKYGTSNESVLRGWINKYNSYREIKDTSKGRTRFLTKGRKTTWDERLQIVLHLI